MKKAKKDKKWTNRNFFSFRSLQHSHSIRSQLTFLIEKMFTKIDTTTTSFPEREPLLKCIAKGFFLNIAIRTKTNINNGKNGNSNNFFNYNNVSNYSNSNNTTNYNNNNNESSIVSHGKFSFSNNNSNNNNNNNIKQNNIIFTKEDTTAPYETLTGRQPVHIHPSSVLFSLVNNHTKKLPECVVYSELLITSKQYMRNITVIDAAWINLIENSNNNSSSTSNNEKIVK
jgi:hypothetical protein